MNSHCEAPPFKYEDINTVLSQIQQDDLMISVDLKNGFQHVLVRPADRDYLGIQWQGVYYRYRVLPFGLNASPFIFCKIVRLVATHLRTQSLRACFYMDDILLMAQPDQMPDHKQLLLSTLRRLGWQLNWEKSELLPTNSMPYIGYKILTNDSGGFPLLTIPAERIYRLRKDIRRVLAQSFVSARQLARIAAATSSSKIQNLSSSI